MRISLNLWVFLQKGVFMTSTSSFRPDPSKPLTRDQAFEILHSVLRNAKRSQSTHSFYHLWVSRFLDFCGVDDIRSLELYDAQAFLVDYVAHHDIADSTFNSALDILRAFYSIVLGQNLTPKQLGKRRIETIQRTLITPQQAHLLFHSARDPRLKAFIGLAFTCGLRSVEIRRLRFKDVRKGAHRLVIRQSKGNKTRTIPYPPSIAKVLNQYFLAYRPACYEALYIACNRQRQVRIYYIPA